MNCEYLQALAKITFFCVFALAILYFKQKSSIVNHVFFPRFIDLFNGEVVGYALGLRITTELVTQSLFRAVKTRRPPRGLIHHSDRGSQYCSPHYQKLLDQFGMTASMSMRPW